MNQLLLLTAAALVMLAASSYAQPNNARNGLPADTGTQVDELMDDQKIFERYESSDIAPSTSASAPLKRGAAQPGGAAAIVPPAEHNTLDQ